MKQVMVDLETTGTDPTHAAIIQIAAVEFSYADETVGKIFDRCLWVPDNRFWAEDTREWWANQRADILDGIFNRAEDPAIVIAAFVEWLRSLSVIEPLQLVAKPATFESPFLASYFRQYGYTNPFHYREVIDMQSFIRGSRGAVDAPIFDKEIPFEGDAHNALDDCLHQVRVMIGAKHRFGVHADA